MSRRTILSSSERESLFALPDNQKDLIQQYTFSESDLSITGSINSLHFLCRISRITPSNKVLDDIGLFLSHFEVFI